MDIRKTGYQLEVSYRAGGGSVKTGSFRARGRKDAFTFYRKFEQAAGSVSGSIIHKGKRISHFVKD